MTVRLVVLLMRTGAGPQVSLHCKLDQHFTLLNLFAYKQLSYDLVEEMFYNENTTISG